jgi:hypothetical protein
VFRVSVVAVRVYIIDPGIKGQQVFWKRYRSFSRKQRFANENAGKKIVVFLARWLRSPVSEPKKHPGAVGRRLLYRVLG